MKEAVAGIGKPRVIEIAVPLDATRDAYTAGKADFRAFDLYTTRALGPDAVLTVHTEGEAVFAEIGKGYPVNFSRAVAYPSDAA